jgi:hypothetical protein
MAKTHIVQVTATGEEHGLLGVLTNSVPYDDFKNMSPEMKAKCEKEKKEDSRIVRVKYHNFKGRHERLSKPYCRWAGDPIQRWHMIPGYEYDVPYGFVKEVNEEQGGMKQRAGLLSVDGKDIQRNGAPLDKDQDAERIHMLVPVEFK